MPGNSHTANLQGDRDNARQPSAHAKAANRRTAHLFVDTNFFLQCKPPEELDWTCWHSFDEVRLIVSKPVLREIDYRKNKGNNRAGKRARDTSARFRRMRQDGQEIVREQSPRVILSIELHHEYSPDFEDRLDYRERDDQLIGTALGFATNSHSSQVWLLTHDTTPLLTAKSLGLPSKTIPDDWLLPPEHTRAEKRLASLEAELGRIKRSEPSFLLQFEDDESGKMARKTQCFEPLTEEQLQLLMKRLRTRFPMETSFGRREVTNQPGTIFGAPFDARTKVFTPPSDEEIAEYKDSLYPGWLEECEAILTDCYKAPRQSSPPRFTFWAENRGTRPAKDALVETTAEGDFLIAPPARTRNRREKEPTAGQESPSTGPHSLPRPPRPPKGRWEFTEDPFRGLRDTFSALRESRVGDPFQTMRDLNSLAAPLPLGPAVTPVRDPNSFYYAPTRSRKPQRSIRLVCAQWRHMGGPEGFAGEIYLRPDQTEVRGALLFRVQAENLSKPASQRIPVRIEVDHISSFDRASALVDALSDAPLDAESGQQT